MKGLKAFSKDTLYLHFQSGSLLSWIREDTRSEILFKGNRFQVEKIFLRSTRFVTGKWACYRDKIEGVGARLANAAWTGRR